MFTRKDYLDDKCSHREYYGQFVTNSHKALVKSFNVDGSNKTPLYVWDGLPFITLAISMGSVGDSPTLAGKVCIFKEACRQTKEENHASS